ncbi:hypothetical protein NTGM5_750005 [Candidatus Nitrotoga sp. M5]|nr:hypothetical protein NTGM5_750005 [Candidatus Nitrotoga sp. M5]
MFCHSERVKSNRLGDKLFSSDSTIVALYASIPRKTLEAEITKAVAAQPSKPRSPLQSGGCPYTSTHDSAP